MAGRPRKSTHESLEDLFFDCSLAEQDALLEKFQMLRRLKARQLPEKKKPEPKADEPKQEALTSLP